MNKNGYRDMEKYRQTRRRQTRKYYKRTAKYPRRDWTDYEDNMILDHAIPDRELSAILNRSQMAICVRRCRLKKGD